jgi:hypothetical protein
MINLIGFLVGVSIGVILLRNFEKYEHLVPVIVEQKEA